MPILVPDATKYPPTDGTPLPADDFRAIFRDSATPSQAFNIINGLDQDNIDPAWTIGRDYVQRGAQVGGAAAAGTVNLDYIWQWFADYDSANGWTPYPDFDADPLMAVARPIPGGNRTFRLRYDAEVKIAWQVMWTNDNDGSNNKASQVVFCLDGAPIQMRKVGRTIVGGAHDGYAKSRWWTGHQTASLDKGYHTAGLWLAADPDIKQTRVWARCLNVKWYKN